jgi:hypothetical protein
VARKQITPAELVDQVATAIQKECGLPSRKHYKDGVSYEAMARAAIKVVYDTVLFDYEKTKRLLREQIY